MSKNLEVKHGTIYAYQCGCRCDDCKIANRDHSRKYRPAPDPLAKAYAETEPEFFKGHR